jgi:hypothetical protein
MRTIIARPLVAAALLGMGWGAAKAQVSEPNFEMVVEAPAGATTITCLRGCRLMWIERGISPNAGTMRTFEFSCQGGGVQRCSSAKVGGWITP